MDEQQVETKVEQTAAPIQPQTAQAEQSEPDSPQSIDWKRFKEARKVERQQKEEAEKRAAAKSAEAEALKAAMEALLSKPSVQSSQVEQGEETDEQRIARLVRQEVEAREKHGDELRRQREASEIPNRIAAMFPDFDEVCSEENKDYLKFHHPEVYAAFDKMPNTLETYATIYKGMKRYIPNPSGKKDQAKAEKNLTRPQSMSVGGVTQTGDTAPMMLDEKRKQDNWSRMQKRMKGIS